MSADVTAQNDWSIAWAVKQHVHQLGVLAGFDTLDSN
jgi:hypothetical protein